ncbi:MAG: site-specific integrase [Ruminococcaceae bacterium]|nr:site-specific integrase [Oscillospiraceae bacterium]
MPKKTNGTVRQRPDGRWEARATIGGKRISFYADRQSDALKAMRAAQKAADDGVYFEPSRVTVAAWLDTWLTEYAAPSLKPLSLSAYESRIGSHIKPALGKIRLADLNPTQIQTFYNSLTREKSLSPKTVKNVHGILHKCLSQAVKLRYIGFNPCDICELPRMERREIKPLTEREICAFLAELRAGEEFSALFTVALFTGMREGEICGLAWNAVDFRAGTITVRQQLQKEKKKGGCHYIAATKNDRTRTITAAPYVMGILREIFAEQKKQHLACGLAWRNEWNLVFTRPDGSFIPPQTALKHFKKIAERIGRPDARFHDLRHTYAVTALQEGDSVKTVQENLGHSTASFTLDVYGHVSEKMKAESAARMENFIEKISG